MENKKMKNHFLMNKILRIVGYIFLLGIVLYTLFPLYMLFVNSFKSNVEIVDSPLALPKSLDFKYIIEAAQKINLFKAIGVTTLITFVSVTIIVISSAFCAWALVRNKTKKSGFIFLLFVSGMLVPFQAIMYPLIDIFDKLGLKNLPGLVIMYGGFGLGLSIFLYHGFIKSIPVSIEEAAIIDGANIFQMFFMVVFPLLKPITITVIILNAIWIWNDYLLPFLVIGNRDGVKTLTLELFYAKQLAGQYGNPWELIFPSVAVSILPIVIAFIFLQKYFVKGAADGAVKS